MDFFKIDISLFSIGASLETVELIHLVRDKEGRQRVVRQHLLDYWHDGVTARINNSRDVHKPPQPAGEVTSTALKVNF